MKTWLKIILFAVLLVAASACSQKAIVRETTTIETVLDDVRRDTLYLATNPVIHYTDTTLYVTRPYYIQVDTVIRTVHKTLNNNFYERYDSVKIFYDPIKNFLEMSLRQNADSIFNQVVTTIKETERVEKTSVIDKYAYIFIIVALLTTIFLILTERYRK